MEKRARTGRPNREEAAALSDHVVKTAGDLFVRNGYSAVSINAVAAAAKVAKHTIYRRFADKSALFAEVIRRRTDLIQRAYAEETAIAGDPLVRMRVLGEKMARMALDAEWVALYRMTIAEGARFPELTPILFTHTADRLAVLCIGLIADAQKSGRLAQGDPGFLAGQFMQLMGGSLLNAALAGRKDFDDPARLQAYMDQSWALFLNACRPGEHISA